jgi:hypothetical protein
VTCPTDYPAVLEHHERVRTEAFCALEGAIPATSPQALRLLATRRPWPALGRYVGECSCGSSLLFGSLPSPSSTIASSSQIFGLAECDG